MDTTNKKTIDTKSTNNVNTGKVDEAVTTVVATELATELVTNSSNVKEVANKSVEIKPVVTEEIKPVVTEEIKPVVTEEIKPVVTEEIKPVIVETVMLVLNDKLSSDNLSFAFDVITNTMSNMPQITNAYTTFYNTLSRVIIQKPEEEVMVFLKNVTAFIELNKDDAFSPRKAFRWFDSLPSLNSAQTREFLVILQILIDYVNDRVGVKKLNWEIIKQSLLPQSRELMLERLQNFVNSNF